MPSRQRLFRTLYRLGFTPWDGHPLSQCLRDLVEGSGQTPALKPGRALDIGCGTGDSSIYLAQHGWQVTGVDYVSKPLATARAKAEASGVSVEFVETDVTRLSATGIAGDLDLVVDNGCLHGMSAGDRDAYVREVTAASAPTARLVIVAFVPGSSFGVPGIAPAEVEWRFTPAWQLLTSGDETAQDHHGRNQARNYLFARHAR
jgi:SAM-dependent methyltransferase